MTDRTMPDAHPLRSGDPERLGTYDILGRLGEGGQGAVFLGRGSGEYVAIKLLHAGLTGDEAARARFVRELEVAKRVARFCTAQVLDADVAGDQPYIVSEYVAGLSLHRLVEAEGPRSGGALERLAISTLTAMIAIHQAGIVHRDFKPHNVMIGTDGPRVIDFGVARALGAAGETQNVGTPAYMAPEHFTGGQVGPAADMFAWGTTMAFAATGRPAFGNDEMAAVMHRILTGEPDLGALQSPLRDIVLACLAKEPERRPSARQAQEGLVGAASGGGYPVPLMLTDPRAGLPAEPGSAEPGRTERGHTAPQPPPYQDLIMPVPLGQAPGASPPPGGAVPPPDGPTPPPGGPPPGGPPSPFPPGGQPPRRRRAGRRLVPLAAAAAVFAVLAGGSVWAATRSGDDGGGNGRGVAANDPTRPAGQEGQAGNPAGQGGTPSKNPKKTPGKPGRPADGRGNDNGQNDPAQSGGGTPTKPSGGGGGGGGTGGGGSTPEPANKYTPQQACNGGGHGGGFTVQRSLAVSGGTAYLLYGNGLNCAVTMKTKNVGKASPVSVWLQRQSDGKKSVESGSYSWYAGPVFISAPKICVRFGGNGVSSTYANCG
ncbi:serine/threonine-protein kinase [Spirillospora sp. NPDC047279]|uniref:serine/threonine protein kinase n=1 Tax=Spirillospora sp. NPDC047279 TaxID=3155478 RepID=UPI0033F076E8